MLYEVQKPFLKGSKIKPWSGEQTCSPDRVVSCVVDENRYDIFFYLTLTYIHTPSESKIIWHADWDQTTKLPIGR